MTTVPLLTYLACTVETKDKLSTNDLRLIALSFLNILFGYLVVVSDTNRYLSVGCLSLSFGSFAASYVVNNLDDAEYAKRHIRKSLADENKTNIVRMQSNLKILRGKQRKQRELLFKVLLYVVFPYFPIVYLLAMHNVLEYSETIIANSIGSLLGKLVFCTLLLSAHIDMQFEFNLRLTLELNVVQRLAENRAVELRSVVRNVAHDLKTVRMYT